MLLQSSVVAVNVVAEFFTAIVESHEDSIRAGEESSQLSSPDADSGWPTLMNKTTRNALANMSTLAEQVSRVLPFRSPPSQILCNS